MNIAKLKSILEKIEGEIFDLESNELNIFEEKGIKKYADAQKKLKEERIQQLIKEAYMLGSSGSVCRYCNGTGRS